MTEFFRCFIYAKSIDEIQWSKCQCKVKFPKDELSFYALQKFQGKGKIGPSRDVKGSLQLQKQESKSLQKEQEQKRIENQKIKESSRLKLVDPRQASALISKSSDDSELSDDSLTSSDSDDNYEARAPPKAKTRNCNSLEMTVSYAKRHNVSSRVLAGIINSLRIDDGETEESRFCSTGKIDNEWSKIQANVTKRHSNISRIECVKFDGKKGASMLPHMREEVVEKITCIYEPGGAYLHHFQPSDGCAETIAFGVFKVLLIYDSLETILAVGGDNCPTNTGSKN